LERTLGISPRRFPIHSSSIVILPFGTPPSL
jgi:hypothetical protein